MAPNEVDAAVSAQLASGASLYTLDEVRLAEQLYAEGLTRLARAAVDGTGETMYAGEAERSADIESWALQHNLKHNKVLHERNLFVDVQHHERPWIGFDQRCEVESLGHDCWQVTLHFGFKNDPDVPEALQLLAGRGVRLDEMETSLNPSRGHSW